MFEIGRLCMKIAGRDAGKIAVVIDVLDNNYVMIDGQTRRRKCNMNHLEMIDKIIEIKKNASNSDVVEALKELNIEVEEKKSADKVKSDKPVKARKIKQASKDSSKSVEKAVKKESKEAKPKAEKSPAAKKTVKASKAK